MEFSFMLVVVIVLAYLLGSIPTAVWVGKIFHGIDVREHGSGNAGATNTIRVLGYKSGIPVLIIDMLKGYIAVTLSDFFAQSFSEHSFSGLQILLGIIAVVGHIWPLFAGFKGGKGVATMFGVLMALQIYPTLIGIAVFLICLFITRYVSVSSMAAGISFPISVYFIEGFQLWPLTIFALLIPFLFIYTHWSNIQRLRKGEESKADFLFKKKNAE
jgi:glycerol-3-phosphate acyltransferase PlsY